MARWVILLILLGLVFGGLSASAIKPHTAKEVLADELLPQDLLTTGDIFQLIIEARTFGVSSVTYHYEYAD
jgi:hypothetical protein